MVQYHRVLLLQSIDQWGKILYEEEQMSKPFFGSRLTKPLGYYLPTTVAESFKGQSSEHILLWSSCILFLCACLINAHATDSFNPCRWIHRSRWAAAGWSYHHRSYNPVLHHYICGHGLWHAYLNPMASSSSVAMPILALVVLLLLGSSSAQLSTSYYSSSCPDLFSTVSSVVQSAISKEKRMGASLLRLFFHDCFVNVAPLPMILRLSRLLSWNSASDMLRERELVFVGVWWFDTTGWHLQLHRGEDC